MNKWHFWLAIVVLGVMVVFSIGGTAAAPELKVQKALGVTGGSDVHKIPLGSTITHLPDGSTKVTGPNGKSVISVESSEVGLIPTTRGMARADRVYQVPSGSFVHGTSQNTLEIYDADGKLILTVIDQAGEVGLEAFQTIPASYEWGWIEYGRSTGRRSYSHLYGQWTVPAAPQNSWIDDDVVYLFNGIQGTGANAWAGREVILQPVVGFNENGLWPGNPLNGRVWVVSSAGSVKTSAIGVSVGNVITGGMSFDPGQQRWVASIRNKSTGTYKVLTTDLLGTTSQFVTCTLEGYNLETDSDLFGTTDFTDLLVRDQNGNTINPSWYEVIDPEAEDYFTGLDVVVYGSSRVKLRTDRVPSGGGCPFLEVWDGSEYVGEGYLNIHNAEGVDVTYEHVLMTVPESVNGAYEFRLIEHPKTISNIDQVQLHAILEDGTVKELHLISAQHSEDGNVLNLLLKSDDRRVEEKGADHNGGTSQSIGLRFAALGLHTEPVAFIFRIEGYNMYVK